MICWINESRYLPSFFNSLPQIEEYMGGGGVNFEDLVCFCLDTNRVGLKNQPRMPKTGILML